MDPLTALIVIGSVVAGWVIGRSTRRHSPSVSIPTHSLCSCGHGYGTHEEGAQCRAQVERVHYFSTGHPNGYEWKPCPCRSYDGPEPLPRIWTEGPL